MGILRYRLRRSGANIGQMSNIEFSDEKHAAGDTRLKGKKSAIKPGRYGRGTGIPNPIDVHVGKRIRMRRLLLGMNQETLANALRVSYQQIQKYEHGSNRVSASRLSATADILGVPISFFFEGFAPGTPEETALRERLAQPETIKLVRLYYTIPDATVRQQFLEMVKAVAAREPEADMPLPEAPMQRRRGRRARRFAGD
jgi:transcriptional regulator with XRE-family HTH domain